MFEIWIPEVDGCLTQISKFENYQSMREWISKLQIRCLICMPHENPNTIKINEDKYTLSPSVIQFQETLWGINK